LKKDDPEARQVRAVGAQRDSTDPTDPSEGYRNWLEHRDPVIVANAVICLIHQANYLLDQQIAALERDFIQEGGYTEQLAAARLGQRRRQRSAVPEESTPSGQSQRDKEPTCPACGKPMVVRTARHGKNIGSQFWGCSGYPECRTTRPLDL
jgi:four helix bundle suffix protein